MRETGNRQAPDKGSIELSSRQQLQYISAEIITITTIPKMQVESSINITRNFLAVFPPIRNWRAMMYTADYSSLCTCSLCLCTPPWHMVISKYGIVSSNSTHMKSVICSLLPRKEQLEASASTPAMGNGCNNILLIASQISRDRPYSVYCEDLPYVTFLHQFLSAESAWYRVS